MCCSSTLNTEVLFYDIHDSYFDDSALKILRSNHIESFILKAGEYVNEQSNDNGQKLKINNVHVNERMTWRRKYGTLKFTLSHINYVLVKTREYFKLSSTTITQKYFNRTHLLPLYLLDKGMNHQHFLETTKTSNGKKFDEI